MALRHPGLGWPSFVFADKEAAEIAEWLSKICSSGRTPPITRGYWHGLGCVKVRPRAPTACRMRGCADAASSCGHWAMRWKFAWPEKRRASSMRWLAASIIPVASRIALNVTEKGWRGLTPMIRPVGDDLLRQSRHSGRRRGDRMRQQSRIDQEGGLASCVTVLAPAPRSTAAACDCKP